MSTFQVQANGKKVDVSKQGLNSIKNPTVKLNLMGTSKTMKNKDWVDPQGRKGKVRAGFLAASLHGPHQPSYPALATDASLHH